MGKRHPNLPAWQWRNYPQNHQHPTNLALHLIAVPLFIVGFLLIVSGVFSLSLASFAIGVVGTLAGLVEYEAEYDMHMVGKHGPEVQATKVSRRSIDRKDPITGKIPKNKMGVPSSQFNSWKLLLQAWTKATTRVERGLPRHTGVDDKKNDIVRLELPEAGRGYKPNKKDKNNPSFNPSMNGAEMKFREDGTPFTLFPIKD